jgi:hypothetical protein
MIIAAAAIVSIPLWLIALELKSLNDTIWKTKNKQQ